jgi:hypothetical protein
VAQLCRRVLGFLEHALKDRIVRRLGRARHLARNLALPRPPARNPRTWGQLAPSPREPVSAPVVEGPCPAVEPARRLRLEEFVGRRGRHREYEPLLKLLEIGATLG